MNSTNFLDALSNTKIEDILVRQQHFFYFLNNQWNGPIEDATLKQRAPELVTHIAESAGLQLGLTQPSADAFLDLEPFGHFRAHVVSAPMSIFKHEITLRRLSCAQTYALNTYGANESLARLLESHVQGGSSILISGATGSGKTSFISSLMALLAKNIRVLILEDSPELSLPNACSSKMLARTNRYQHRLGAEWNLQDLVFESLRMRPERIVLGECRGPEAEAVAVALRTGHQGVMTTLHAGNCTEALNRFDELANSSKSSTSKAAHTWDLVVHLDKKSIKEILCPKAMKRWNFSSCAFEAA